MRTAQVSELKDRLDEVIEAVKNGETVEIWEGNTSLAELVPHSNGTDEPEQAPRATGRPDQTALYAHLDELVRQGKARRGTGKLPDDFFTRPRPKFEEGSVLEQLLRDREED
jgi:antitoxin (DNA-binding transcriptional repressor) of toxin-antitoxin stability system